MDRLDVLKSLKNDQEYYTGIGKQFLSNSDVGTLLNNPSAFGSFRKDGKSFAEGRLFHQLLLELYTQQCRFEQDQIYHT